MSTNKTKNLNLHSWVETDPVLMSEFNDNFTALDTAVKNTNNAITTKVSAAVTELTGMIDDVSDSVSEVSDSVGEVTSSVSKVSNTVSGLSDSVDEISDTVSGITNTISDMEAASLKICTGSYTGDGSTSLTLHFPFSPKFVHVSQNGDHVTSCYITTPAYSSAKMWQTATNSHYIRLTWGSNSMTVAGSQDYQLLNAAGYTVNYVAFGI